MGMTVVAVLLADSSYGRPRKKRPPQDEKS